MTVQTPRGGRRPRRPDLGFTMVEILVAIVLVGVLSAVVVVGVGELTSQGNAAACAATGDAARAAARVHRATTASWPETFDEMVSSGSLDVPGGVSTAAGGMLVGTVDWSLVLVPGAPPTFVCTGPETGVALVSMPTGAFVRVASDRALTPDATEAEAHSWQVVAGIAGSGVSFASISEPGFYLRHAGFQVWSHVIPTDGTIDVPQRDATWIMRPGLSGRGVSFESENYPGRYLEASSSTTMHITVATTDPALRERMTFSIAELG